MKIDKTLMWFIGIVIVIVLYTRWRKKQAKNGGNGTTTTTGNNGSRFVDEWAGTRASSQNIECRDGEYYSPSCNCCVSVN